MGGTVLPPEGLLLLVTLNTSFPLMSFKKVIYPLEFKGGHIGSEIPEAIVLCKKKRNLKYLPILIWLAKY